MAILVTVLAVVLALLAVLVAGLLRSHAEILRELHGLGADLDPDADADGVSRGASTTAGITVPRPRAETRPASDVTGVTPTGDATSVAVVGARHHTLIAFLTSGCTTCVDFWNAFADAAVLHIPGGARLVVVTKGEESESPARLRKFTPRDVPVVMSSEAWDAYDVPVAPYFVFVDGPNSRIVGEGAASTWGHLANMMEEAIADAGVSVRRGRGWRADDGRAREARADRDLLAAGIEPGHPSLYPRSEADLHDQEPRG